MYNQKICLGEGGKSMFSETGGHSVLEWEAIGKTSKGGMNQGG